MCESMKRLKKSSMLDFMEKSICYSVVHMTYKNNVVLRNDDAQPGHIINLAANICGIIMFYLEFLVMVGVQVTIHI